MNVESKKRVARLREQLSKHPTLVCADCGVPIHEAITGKYETNDGTLCRRCFAKVVGNEIEQHPIRSMSPERIA